MTKIKPTADNILVEPLKHEAKTPSGLVIPDTAKEKPQEGKVVAVGPGKYEDGKRIKPDVKVGAEILYRKYGGTEVKIEGKNYLIISSDDVLAIIE